MENYNGNIQVVFEESTETTQRILALITEEEPDLKDMLSRVNIVSECSSTTPRIYLNGFARLTADTNLQRLNKTLLRDFLLSMPRIAAIRTISLSENSADGVRLFGPYTQEMMFDQQDQYSTFDIIVTENDQQAISLLEEMSEEPVVALLPDENQVIVEASVYKDNDEANGSSIRKAVYLALDIAHNRNEYDSARRRPLQKLYHERPDGGEKLRFKPFAPVDKPAAAPTVNP